MGFKDFLGGPSKCFTQANKKQQRETVHAVYSVSKNRSECNSIGELRSEPTILEKISLQRELSVSENCSDLNTIGEFRSKPTNLEKISHHIQRSVAVTTDLLSSASPAKLARVTYLSTLDECEQIGGNKCIIRLGSGAKLDKFRGLLKICFLCVFIFSLTMRVLLI